MNYTTQLQVQVMATGMRDLPGNRRTPHPSIPTSSCQMSQRLPMSAHSPQHHLGGRSWERRSENEPFYPRETKHHLTGQAKLRVSRRSHVVEHFIVFLTAHPVEIGRNARFVLD